MDLRFIWEALLVLAAGFFLLRIAGKKTAGERTGLEIITMLAMASMIGHAVAGDGLLKTIITLCLFVALLLTVQFLAIKFDWMERVMIGKATLVIQDGKIIPANLKKLRMSVDQLEARIREKGISSFADIKTATIESSGRFGYELVRKAKPVTIAELEAMLAPLLPGKPKLPPQPKENLFTEVIHEGHDGNPAVSQQLD
ncbi:DUF421 domain-containing protein [Paenibacillus sp. GCM10027626]|uniref:DUF421 domain-containing protein n=1 Tax=Paenibacillus sp. GCM10027626 TaxID=3273411 RepID=UPI00362765D5